MATEKKAAETAAESAQEPVAAQEVSQPQESGETPQTAPEGAPSVVLGPEDPETLLGCMDPPPDEGEIEEGFVFHEYAVIASHGLKLRKEPSLDAPVLAVLPSGAGVWTDTVYDSELEWTYVRTGTLAGWMMTKYLTPIEV